MRFLDVIIEKAAERIASKAIDRMAENKRSREESLSIEMLTQYTKFGFVDYRVLSELREALHLDDPIAEVIMNRQNMPIHTRIMGIKDAVSLEEHNALKNRITQLESELSIKSEEHRELLSIIQDIRKVKFAAKQNLDEENSIGY